jgi:hypothetical protein
MIVKAIGDYKLTQIEGSGIITIKKKGKFVNKVLGLLTDDKAQAIIFELGR